MLKIFLYPLSALYGIVIFVRNLLYDWDILKSKEFDVPVISVGNITVGGTGKTPHVEHLIGLLREKFDVVTLSRGYKRKTSGFRIVEVLSKASEVGDEPLQIKGKFPDTTVAVSESRVKGVGNILGLAGEKSPDVIILDDAFQHRKIYRGINILLIDYNRPVTADKLLPVGRLRESAGQIRRANIIIFTKCPENEVTPIMKRIIKKDILLKPYQDIIFYTFSNEKILHHNYSIISGLCTFKCPNHHCLSQRCHENKQMKFKHEKVSPYISNCIGSVYADIKCWFVFDCPKTY